MCRVDFKNVVGHCRKCGDLNGWFGELQGKGHGKGVKVITAGDIRQNPTGNKVSLALLLSEQLVLIKLPFHFYRENGGKGKKTKGKGKEREKPEQIK